METKRLFIAFLLDKKYIEDIYQYSNSINREVWNPTIKENLHITLLWLGDVPTSVIPQSIEILENICSKTKPMTLKNGKVMIMKPDKPYMIWIKYMRNKWFDDIVLELEKYFWKIGTWKEKRDRKQRKEAGDKIAEPHITLARTIKGKYIESLLAPFDIEEDRRCIRLDRIALLQSTIDSDKSDDSMQYKIIWEKKL